MEALLPTEIIKAEALRLGFSACGAAPAEAVSEKVADTFRQWLADGCQGEMAYMQNYEDKRLDINEYLIRNPVSTFFFPVQGDSMQGAEIFDGDILVVDRSVKAGHGHIVVAFVDGERLVKRLHNRNGRVALVAENPAYPAIDIRGDMELVIWGVVIGKFKRM